MRADRFVLSFRRFARVGVVPPLLLGVLAASTMACRDPLHPGAVTPLAADAYEARLVFDSRAGTDVQQVHVRWRGGVSADPIAAFRATLLLPVGVTVVGDAAAQADAQGAMLRVVHVSGDRVLATGASTQGFEFGDLFVLTVRGPAERVAQLRLELEEVVNARGEPRGARATVVGGKR